MFPAGCWAGWFSNQNTTCHLVWFGHMWLFCAKCNLSHRQLTLEKPGVNNSYNCSASAVLITGEGKHQGEKSVWYRRGSVDDSFSSNWLHYKQKLWWSSSAINGIYWDKYFMIWILNKLMYFSPDDMKTINTMFTPLLKENSMKHIDYKVRCKKCINFIFLPRPSIQFKRLQTRPQKLGTTTCSAKWPIRWVLLVLHCI